MLELDIRDTLEIFKEESLNIYDGIQSEILNTIWFDENSDLSTTYLERVDITRASKIKGRGNIPNNRTRVYSRKTIGWNRMSDTIGYRRQVIIYVQITLFAL